MRSGSLHFMSLNGTSIILSVDSIIQKCVLYAWFKTLHLKLNYILRKWFTFYWQFKALISTISTIIIFCNEYHLHFVNYNLKVIYEKYWYQIFTSNILFTIILNQVANKNQSNQLSFLFFKMFRFFCQL